MIALKIRQMTMVLAKPEYGDPEKTSSRNGAISSVPLAKACSDAGSLVVTCGVSSHQWI
jgi:hypothetical protein